MRTARPIVRRLTVGQLRSEYERRAHAYQESPDWERVLELRRRVREGNEKLTAAQAAGRDVKPIRGKLAPLEVELRRLEARREGPLVLLDLIREIAQGFAGDWEPGVSVTVRLPPDWEASVEFDSVPF